MWYTGSEGTFEVSFQDEDPRGVVRKFLQAWRNGDLQLAAEFLSIHNFQQNYSQLSSGVSSIGEQTSLQLDGDMANVSAVVDGESVTFTLAKDGFNHWKIYQFSK